MPALALYGDDGHRIRALHSRGATAAAIATEFRVSRSTIQRAKRAAAAQAATVSDRRP